MTIGHKSVDLLLDLVELRLGTMFGATREEMNIIERAKAELMEVRASAPHLAPRKNRPLTGRRQPIYVIDGITSC